MEPPRTGFVPACAYVPPLPGGRTPALPSTNPNAPPPVSRFVDASAYVYVPPELPRSRPSTPPAVSRFVHAGAYVPPPLPSSSSSAVRAERSASDAPPPSFVPAGVYVPPPLPSSPDTSRGRAGSVAPPSASGYVPMAAPFSPNVPARGGHAPLPTSGDVPPPLPTRSHQNSAVAKLIGSLPPPLPQGRQRSFSAAPAATPQPPLPARATHHSPPQARAGFSTSFSQPNDPPARRSEVGTGLVPRPRNTGEDETKRGHGPATQLTHSPSLPRRPPLPGRGAGQ